jgi:hypothetical protein
MYTDMDLCKPHDYIFIHSQAHQLLLAFRL